MIRTAYILLLLTALFWGGNAVAGKLAVGHVSPMALTALRWLFGFSLLVAIGWRQFARDWPELRRHLPFLFLLGSVGFTFFNAALYSALTMTSAINVSIEQAAIPMVIFLINFVLFSQRVSAAQMAGLAASIVGVALTASHGELMRLAELDVNLGDALMVGAVIVYGGYTVALRFKPQVRWQSLMIVLAGSALVSSLPFMAWEYQAGDFIFPDMRGWTVVIYTALFPSVLAQIFYIRGVEIIGGNRAGLFINVVPIFGTLLSILILGEAFHLYHAVAMALVLGGIWLAEASGRKMAAGETPGR
jgi:drug/metabolite transporter (DMT)-like permease